MRRLSARDLALIAVFAALIAALGLPGAIPIPGSPVPITAQTLGVMLAGLVLGPRRAAAAVLVFLLLTAAGLPLLAGGRGGLAVLSGPSAGYLAGWVVGAAVTGVLSRRSVRAATGGDRSAVVVAGLVAAALVGGVLVVYAAGVPVTAARTDLSPWAALTSAAAYLPGDIVKAVIAALIAAGVVRAYPPVVADRA